MSWTNGRPEPEVIVNFADGLSYNKGKMEDFFRSGFLDKPHTAAKPNNQLQSGLKKEDVELVASEFELTRPKAEKALADAGGDVTKALENLSNSN